MPAATYAVSLVARTVYTSSPQTLLVHTPPAPMDIMQQPNVLVSSIHPLVWLPQDTLTVENQYSPLIK